MNKLIVSVNMSCSKKRCLEVQEALLGSSILELLAIFPEALIEVPALFWSFHILSFSTRASRRPWEIQVRDSRLGSETENPFNILRCALGGVCNLTEKLKSFLYSIYSFLKISSFGSWSISSDYLKSPFFSFLWLKHIHQLEHDLLCLKSKNWFCVVSTTHTN